jgi:hypothetical protein
MRIQLFIITLILLFVTPTGMLRAQKQHIIKLLFETDDTSWKTQLTQDIRSFLQQYADLELTITFHSYAPAKETYSLTKDGSVAVARQDASLSFEVVLSKKSPFPDKKKAFTCSGSNHQLLLAALKNILKNFLDTVP